MPNQEKKAAQVNADPRLKAIGEALQGAESFDDFLDDWITNNHDVP